MTERSRLLYRRRIASVGGSSGPCGAGGTVAYVNDLEDVLGLPITRFVDQHVRSLLTWDLLVFFHRTPDAVLDVESLASRLGRRVEELQPEIEALCRNGLLESSGGLVCYRPKSELHAAVDAFVAACQERGRRLALIALVLHKINPHDE